MLESNCMYIMWYNFPQTWAGWWRVISFALGTPRRSVVLCFPTRCCFFERVRMLYMCMLVCLSGKESCMWLYCNDHSRASHKGALAAALHAGNKCHGFDSISWKGNTGFVIVVVVVIAGLVSSPQRLWLCSIQNRTGSKETCFSIIVAPEPCLLRGTKSCSNITAEAKTLSKQQNSSEKEYLKKTSWWSHGDWIYS